MPSTKPPLRQFIERLRLELTIELLLLGWGLSNSGELLYVFVYRVFMHTSP